MRYALLIYTPPDMGEPDPAEFQAVMDAYNAFTRDAVEAGVMRGGEALEDANTATTVRVRDGKTLITDGPFAETKEQFGGFYLIEAPNLDEAIKWAARIPGAQRGSIEVRPIWEIPGSEDAEDQSASGAERAIAGSAS
jgi:hypothetical protein